MYAKHHKAPVRSLLKSSHTGCTSQSSQFSSLHLDVDGVLFVACHIKPEGKSLLSVSSTAMAPACVLSNDITKPCSHIMHYLHFHRLLMQGAVNSWSPCDHLIDTKESTCVSMQIFLTFLKTSFQTIKV